LDTDAFSFLSQAKGPHEAYRDLVAGHELLLPFVVIGEAYYGARKASWGEEKVAALEMKLRKYGVISGTVDVARSFGALAARFKDQIQYDDLWIAASALGQSPPLPLVTNDEGFLRIASEFPLIVVRADE
jgi:predicted nucleic acid-binding protein